MCSCGGLLTEEGIQHVPAPGVCERMGGGLLDSPRFVAVERGLAELREVLGQLRAVSTSADERCGILETAIFASDAVNRVVGTENRLAALAEQVGLIEHLQTHRDSKRIAFCERQVVDLNNRAEALQVRVDVLESFHDPDAGHLRDTPVSDAVTGLAERVAKLEQAEARREKLAAVRRDRLERAGEGIYVPPPMDARDWDPITCQPIAGDFNGPHGPEPAACAVCGSTDPIQHFYHHTSEPTRPSEADVAYVRAEVDRDHYRDGVFRAEATLARLRAWAEELYFGQHDDEHRRCGKVVRHVLAILDGADAKGGG
jgi:hypothetical protein